MYNLENIERINYKNEDVSKLLKLYQYKGKEFYYQKALEQDDETIRKSIACRNAYFISKILNLQIKNNRIKLLITKGSKPKNNDERLVSNLVKVLTIAATNGKDFELITNETVNLAKTLFDGIKTIGLSTKKVEVQDNLLIETKIVSKRDELDKLFLIYSDMICSEDHEVISLLMNFYVDFIHLEPFNEENNLIALILLNVMMIREGFSINLYQSFYEFLFENYEEFMQRISVANYDYERGFSHTEPVTDFMIKGLIKNYESLELFIRNYKFDNKVNKGDNIENTIYRLQTTFTKEDIRAHHPYVSESTINRTLQRLRDEGKITPLGTGRSASWIRVTEGPERFNPNGQLDIFGIGLLGNDED